MENLVLDNSGRSTFRSCKKKFLLQNIHGLQSNFGSTALRYGSTWHAIQEGYHSWVRDHGWPTESNDIMAAITDGLKMGKETYDTESKKKEFYDDFKNFNTAVDGFNAYMDFFKDDKKYMEIIGTEQKFECPIEPENSLEEKILKNLPPIIFTGKIDLQIKMDATPWILDFKTTGWRLDQVVMQANRSPQLIGYSYAGKKVLDFEPQGCLCSFAHHTSSKSKTTGNYGKVRFSFRRIPQIYNQGDIDAWKLSFIDTAREIQFAKDNDLWPESFDNCYQYGACSYLRLCQQHCKFEDLNLDGFHIDHWNVLDE